PAARHHLVADARSGLRGGDHAFQPAPDIPAGRAAGLREDLLAVAFPILVALRAPSPGRPDYGQLPFSDADAAGPAVPPARRPGGNVRPGAWRAAASGDG